MRPQLQNSDTAATRKPWLRKLDFLWLELTPRCNLRCSHCYADAGPNLPEGMSYENWSDVLRQAFDLGCRSVQFTSGEPTPDLLVLHHRRARDDGQRPDRAKSGN